MYNNEDLALLSAETKTYLSLNDRIYYVESEHSKAIKVKVEVVANPKGLSFWANDEEIITTIDDIDQILRKERTGYVDYLEKITGANLDFIGDYIRRAEYIELDKTKSGIAYRNDLKFFNLRTNVFNLCYAIFVDFGKKSQYSVRYVENSEYKNKLIEISQEEQKKICKAMLLSEAIEMLTINEEKRKERRKMSENPDFINKVSLYKSLFSLTDIVNIGDYREGYRNLLTDKTYSDVVRSVYNYHPIYDSLIALDAREVYCNYSKVNDTNDKSYTIFSSVKRFNQMFNLNLSGASFSENYRNLMRIYLSAFMPELLSRKPVMVKIDGMPDTVNGYLAGSSVPELLNLPPAMSVEMFNRINIDYLTQSGLEGVISRVYQRDDSALAFMKQISISPSERSVLEKTDVKRMLLSGYQIETTSVYEYKKIVGVVQS